MSGRFKILLGLCAVVTLLSGSAGAATSIVAAEQTSWTDAIRALWPIIITVGGLISAGVVLGLSLRFPTIAAFSSLKSQVEKLSTASIDHESRLKVTETYCAGTPSRQELQEDIGELRAICSGFAADLSGIKAQGQTTNTYLHTLIERQISR